MNIPEHSLTGFIDHLLSVSPANGQEQLFVYFQSNTFQLVLIRNQALCYCNSFNYRSPEDFMYYLLFACKQLHIDPELIGVILMGEIVRDSVIYQLLTKYIRNIEFAKPFEAIQFDADYPMPHYFFITYFAFSPCALSAVHLEADDSIHPTIYQRVQLPTSRKPDCSIF